MYVITHKPETVPARRMRIRRIRRRRFFPNDKYKETRAVLAVSLTNTLLFVETETNVIPVKLSMGCQLVIKA